MGNIVLHVYYTGAAGRAAAFVAEMQSSGLQAQVQAEDGNLQYDYFTSTADGATVLLLEKWRDGKALQAHIDGDVMRQLKAVKEKYALSTRLERYE